MKSLLIKTGLLGMLAVLGGTVGCKQSLAFPEANKVKVVSGAYPEQIPPSRIWDRKVIQQLAGFMEQSRGKWEVHWGAFPPVHYSITLHGAVQVVTVHCGDDWIGTSLNGRNYIMQLETDALVRMVRMFEPKYNLSQLAATPTEP